jgi:hypothetical protein
MSLRQFQSQRWPDLSGSPEHILHSLGLPASFSVEDLLDAIGAYQDRPVHLLVHDLSFPFSGFWVMSEDMDWVIVARHLSAQERAQTVLHEASHIILHDPAALMSSEDLFSALADGKRLHALARACSYEEQAEHEAEALASFIAVRILDVAVRPEPDEAAQRFLRYLG